ncbi:Signal peptidase I [Rubrivivax sp. A210]|uniref:signal peptidase I n=1 Tax=Rubrivivax sp. A210 TaxID=2772301 RepID=UPI00191B8D20|nr:signal peptidase I [Rubrivivax sp. A210]CAD5370647.1 Signal peptidase I [Rubrivivax sp. A210]
MSTLTAALYGALAVYLGGWFLNYWTGNFSLLLFMLTLVTSFFWLAERFRFRPARLAAADQLEQNDSARRAELARLGIEKVDGDVAQAREKLLMQPWWLDWTAGLFPVILVVFILRSFLFEPFKIPSGSMVPTLLVGDLILVNKFHYGVRLPVINKKIIDNNAVKRGDVMVFRYPVDPRLDYIKRVVGLPGDEVAYLNQKLSINGKLVETVAQGEHYDDDSLSYSPMYLEKLGEAEHKVRVDTSRSAWYGPDPKRFPMAENCRYSPEGVVCKVPPGHYFMMGDNRDNSQDSRFWGFVPDENIVGRAFFVWMNFGNPGRIGPFH